MTRFRPRVCDLAPRACSIAIGFLFMGCQAALPDAPLQPIPAPRQPVPPEEAAPLPRTVPDDGLPANTPSQAPPPTPPSERALAANAKAPPSPTTLPIDLPYALRLVNANNPTIALARERINEARARQQQAAVLWVPNAFIGSNPDAPLFVPTFYHHDGNVQNSQGRVFDTVKSNFALMNGVDVNVNLADAIFAPLIARQATAAMAARARTTLDDVQLDVALTYLDLLSAYGALAINAETLSKAREMLRYAEEAERNGLSKTTADANQARTEVRSRERERFDLEGQVATASARLAQLLLLEPTVDLVPADRIVVPVALVNTDVGLDELIATGLLNRPELVESRALVRQALAEWRSNKYHPLLPFLQATFDAGSFQGGDPGFHNTGYRDDFMIQLGWQLRNGGLGDLGRVRESKAHYNEANLHVLEVQAQVSAEVTSAAKLTLIRERSLRDAEEAVRQAEEMWKRLSKAAFGMAVSSRDKPGQYDPLAPLIAEQQLNAARMQYLDEVISYNRYQFRLYWAMGQPPECALPTSAKVPIQTPVLPSASQQNGNNSQPSRDDASSGKK